MSINERPNYGASIFEEIDDALILCNRMAIRIDIRASKATEEQRKDGTWGNWRHDAEIMRMAVRVLEREIKML